MEIQAINTQQKVLVTVNATSFTDGKEKAKEALAGKPDLLKQWEEAGYLLQENVNGKKDTKKETRKETKTETKRKP